MRQIMIMPMPQTALTRQPQLNVEIVWIRCRSCDQQFSRCRYVITMRVLRYGTYTYRNTRIAIIH
jgi:hypothetical protein